MLSVIICSTQPDIHDSLKKNINETIGVDYELIIIDNSKKIYSIFSAYNFGLKKSNYSNICLIHQDVFFHSKNWGLTVCKHLEDKKCGLLGVSGGTTVPRIPSPWSFYEITGFVIQSDYNDSKPELQNSGVFNEKNYKQVITLDGVFLCARKELFKNVGFDEMVFTGFHCYDIDICLQTHFGGFENRVVNNILLEHRSKGKLNRQWVENSMLLCDKWRKKLPVSISGISDELLAKREIKFMTRNYLKIMIRASYSNKEIKKCVYKYLGHIKKTKTWNFRISLIIRIFIIRLIKKPSSLFQL